MKINIAFWVTSFYLGICAVVIGASLREDQARGMLVFTAVTGWAIIAVNHITEYFRNLK